MSGQQPGDDSEVHGTRTISSSGIHNVILAQPSERTSGERLLEGFLVQRNERVAYVMQQNHACVHHQQQ